MGKGKHMNREQLNDALYWEVAERDARGQILLQLQKKTLQAKSAEDTAWKMYLDCSRKAQKLLEKVNKLDKEGRA